MSRKRKWVLLSKERKIASASWDLSSMHQLDFKFSCNRKFNSNFCKLKDLLNYVTENSRRRVNFRSIWLGSVISCLGLWFCVRSILLWLSSSWQNGASISRLCTCTPHHTRRTVSCNHSYCHRPTGPSLFPHLWKSGMVSTPLELQG